MPNAVEPEVIIQQVNMPRRLKEILSHKNYALFTIERKKREVVITNPANNKQAFAPLTGGDWKLWEKVEANIKLLLAK